MLARLTVTLESLDRFEGKVVVDLSGPLTVIVGPNGSGKSTILEAVAEVMTFFAQCPVEGVESDLRRNVPTQRPTRPKWARATVALNYDDTTALQFPDLGSSLRDHLGESVTNEVRFTVVKRANSDRWTLASIAMSNHELAFDTSGPIVVDSRRLKEAQTAQETLAAELAQHEAERVALRKKLTKQISTIAQPPTPENQALAQNLREHISALEAKHAHLVEETNRRRSELDDEIRAATNGALRLEGGGEVAKADVEALRDALRLPRVIYLQGQPNFEGLISKMTAKAGALRALPRSEHPSSAFIKMRDRLHALLKMDVAVDSTEDHALLIDGRRVDEVSAGTWCALGFAGLCEQEDETALVIWDEPETGLHPTWARKICDLMIRDPRRFLVATHRTEFVPVNEPSIHIYKSVARPPAIGAPGLCRLSEATNTLASGLAIAVALGLEPARVLFTANSVLWVEGPSDVIYWRFWLENAAKQRSLELVEGCDYCFMFSAGSLLANETVADSTERLSRDAVNLLRLIGASRVIVDTDFNPEATPNARITEAELHSILSATSWHNSGFVDATCRPHLKPRVRSIAEAIDEIRKKDNLSSIVTTWGREAENGLTDDAFRRTLKRIYGVEEGSASAKHIESLSVGDWIPYESAIRSHLEPALTRSELQDLVGQLRQGPAIAQMSVIEDKRLFAQNYVEAHADVGSSLRPQAQRIVDSTLEWICTVRDAYLQ